jgi:hypothetical protein
MLEREATKRGNLELLASIAVYTLILIPAIYFGSTMEDGAARTAVMLSPMIGFMLALWAIIRQFRRVDEFIRLRTLENIAVAAAVTAGVTFSYGFLENVGYPRLSMFVVWPVMGAVWGVLAIVRHQILDRAPR